MFYMRLSRRVPALLTLLSVAVLVVAGCSARAGAGDTVAAYGDSSLVVDLPAITIDYDAEGNPSLGQMPLADLESLLTPAVLAQLTLTKDVIDTVTAANIQHIQISNAPSGLIILVNGERIPSLSWDDAKLANLAELVDAMGPAVPPVVKAVLPLITNVGAGVVVRFPVAQGADMIPMVVAGDTSAAAQAQAQAASFLDEIGYRPVIHIPVYYDADGDWTVQGMTDAEWQALTGVPFGALRLSAEIIQGAQDAGISQVTIRTDAEGIHVALNDKELPTLGWGEGELNHALTLALQSGMVGGGGLDAETLAPILDTLLPAIQSSDVTLNVDFPTE